MQVLRAARRETRVDITSLIDVAFLMIIFLVVTTTFLKEQELELNLPRAQGPSAEAREGLNVEVSASGEMFFRGRALDRGALVDSLRGALASSDDKTVSLRADRASSHGDVVKAMDAIREAGAAGLSIAVEHERAAP
jgi:biopolymer transport protein ExbD